jgi:hypothetical protein
MNLEKINNRAMLLGIPTTTLFTSLFLFQYANTEIIKELFAYCYVGSAFLLIFAVGVIMIHDWRKDFKK